MREEKLGRLKKLVLLLVEDDRELLEKLTVILSIFFGEVITAENGKEALNIYKTQKIDMIISDYSMPVMGGYELLKQIRQKNKKIPLTIISNFSDKEKLLNSIPLSLANYLVKPIEYTTLTETLIAMIERLEDGERAIYEISDTLRYNMANKELRLSGELVSLTKSEIAILELFLQYQDKLISNKEIELTLHPVDPKSNAAVKSIIYRLRNKIGKEMILNIPGHGFMFKVKSL